MAWLLIKAQQRPFSAARSSCFSLYVPQSYHFNPPLTRLTNAFSKKVENHAASVAILLDVL
jgi:hypothetical protein